MSSASVSRSSPIASGGRKRSTLPNVPQVSTMTPRWCAAEATALARSGAGSSVPERTSSTAIIAPRPRTSPMRSSSACMRLQPILHQPLDLLGPVDQVVGLDGLDGRQRQRRRPAGARRRCRRGRQSVRRVHDGRRTVTADSGMPPRCLLAVTIRSGTTPRGHRRTSRRSGRSQSGPRRR